MEKLLKNKKVRVTPFRLEVLEVFNDKSNALSLSDIEEGLGEFDRITLYRTLKTFQEKGIVHEISIGGAKKYAICEPDCCSSKSTHHQHSHIHFQCKKCDEIYCLDVPVLPDFNIPGYAIDTVDVQTTGTCKKCA